MKKTKIEDKQLEEEIDRKARKVVRKGVEHEEHLPRFGLPIDDQYLSDRLMSNITSNPLFDASGINIEVNSGTVIVQGKIADRLQKDFLLESIKLEEGVREVVDHISVAHEWIPRRKLDPEVTHDYD